MPTITVRISELELAEVRRNAGAQDKTVSEYVREALKLTVANLDEAVADLDRRLCRLEQMAGVA